MGFSFGAPAAPSGAGTPAPAAAPAVAAPAATTGFSFGAPSATTATTAAAAPSTTAPATATAPAAPSTGFSFGGTTTAPPPASTTATVPAAAPTTGAPPAAAGGLFSALPTTANNNNNNATQNNAGINSNTATATAAPGPIPIATIPHYSTAFPRMQIQHRVETSLARYKNSHHETSSGGGGSSSSSSSSFAAQELIHLLSTANKSGGRGEEDAPVGAYLANPTSLLKFSGADANLRRQLQPNAAPPPVAAGNTAFGNNTAAAAAANNNAMNNNTTTNNNNNAYITLKGQLTAVTPKIAREALQLAEELHLTEVEALGLYAEANIMVHNGNNRQEEEGKYEDEQQGDFVKMLIRGGKVGFETKDDTKQQQAGVGQQQNPMGTNNQQQQQQASFQPQKDTETTTPRPYSAVVQTAQRLFFQERSALLATISDLIRHRVEAADGITSQQSSSTDLVMHDGNSHGESSNGASSASSSAVLVATDQLLKAGLVTNLIGTVRELTGMIAEIGERLKAAERSGVGNANAMPAASAAAAPTFGTGLFGSTPTPVAAAAAPATNNQRNNYYMEYALLGFTHLQRQVASECLFYLAYHTQLNVDEVVGLIDLIKDLTNGSSQQGGGGGLPLLNPLMDDVPSPYEALDSTTGISMATSWQHQQQQHASYYNNFYGGGGGGVNQWNQHHHPAAPQPTLKNAQQWEAELITSLWKRGQPQLLQCVSTLIMSVICALDARHILVNRENHGPNGFGVGNALFPPDSSNATQLLQPIHSRLDPSSSNAEEAWKRRDIWGLLLVPYALLLRNTASQLMSPRGSPTGHYQQRSPTAGGGVIDVKSTFSKCLMVASQLKSLTFARLSLLPSFSSSSSSSPNNSTMDGGGDGGSSTSFEFYLTTLSELTAQYIDALGATGNLPITRKEWLDEEVNLAQSEYLENEQKRQFGVWAGTATEQEDGEDKEVEGVRAINVMDRPDCLEDVFALVSGVCELYPSGARAFWYSSTTTQATEVSTSDAATGVSSPSSVVLLAPSRALQTLDLLQSENESSLFVYLSFLGALALCDDDGAASMVHSFLCGERTINPLRAADRRMHFLWSTIISSIRWYAERLSVEEEAPAKESTPADRIRRSSSTMDTTAGGESSTSYYYGVGGGLGSSSGNGDVGASSSSPEQSTPGQSTSGNNTASKVGTADSKTKELDEVGRNTLMALLCLISNVASKCGAAREFILGIQLPALDSDGTSSNSGMMYQDGSLEILFSLLTTSLPPEIMGLCFTAIANLLQPTNSEQVGGSGSPAGVSTAGSRAWELLELCQFIPIKLLSQFSSYATGAGSAIPHSSRSSTNYKPGGQQQGVSSSSSGVNNDLPGSMFPDSADYSMIYQFEHVESKVLGSFPATEGFLFLLSTLVKVAGCPSTLGSQWRLRPGCAPYVEYVTDFVLPRATGLVKDVKKVAFSGVSEECRLIVRAMEVVEAVLVRYVVPPIQIQESVLTFKEVKDRHLSNIKVAKTEMGLAPALSEIFGNVDNIEEGEMNDSFQDFRNILLPPQDGSGPNNANRNQSMLEASFGSQIPLPKTPGFSILSNLLSTNGSLLFQILQKLLSENGGSKGIHEYSESINSRSLATCLFRETPPNMECTKESSVCKARHEQNLIDVKAYQGALSMLQQSMIQPLNPLLLQSYFERSFQDGNNKAHGASLEDAVLWRERTLLISLRILCAAAAREKSFILSLKQAGSSLSVVPTLLFKGPIHGSFAHRFVHEEKVGVSRLSHLLTTASSSSSTVHDNSSSSSYFSPEMLPAITQYVGYRACALSNPQGIARSSFSIVSYICHTLPHAEATHSLCGKDMNGIGLAHAFSKGLSMHSPGDNDNGDDAEESSSSGTNLQAAILDLIISNMKIGFSSNNLNLSLMMLGLSSDGASSFDQHNCLSVILELVSETAFVIDPRTSASAAKCFEILYRVCEMVVSSSSAHSLPPNVSAQQLRWMEKLRRENYWHGQVVHYLGMRGPAAPSIFHEVSNSYRFEHGEDTDIMMRDNDVLHSISWLLKGLAIELHCLMGRHHGSKRLYAPNNQMQSLLDCLLSPPNPLLLTVLADMPLGQSKNEFIRERLHIGAPSSDILRDSSRPMQGPVEICAGYEIIDLERLLSHFKGSSDGSNNTPEKAREWAMAWNSFVSRVCACTHISQAWSDAVRTALIYSPMVIDDNIMVQREASFHRNTRAIMDILCVILLRLLSPSHLDTLSQYGIFLGAQQQVIPQVESVEAECAMPLSIAALSLTEILIESSRDVAVHGVQDEVVGFGIAEEDVAKVCALIVGAISSCSESGAGMSNSDGRSAVLSCALTQLLAFSDEAAYSIFSQISSPMLDIYANAVVVLFHLSTAPVYHAEERYLNAHEAKRGVISLAARSGLSSLFGHLKSIEDSVSDLFCSKIFTLDALSAAISQLVQLITSDDNDVAYLLQQVALFRDGVQVLAKSGITAKLLEFAGVISSEEQKFLLSNMGTNSAAQLKPPSLLNGHLSLINALLSSPLVISDRVALAVDSYQILKVYSGILERQVQSYPSNSDLTNKFIEALHLTYTSLKESSVSNILGNTPLNADDSSLTLERSVLFIAYQLSSFPFPSNLLPPLPMELINVENVHKSQMKNITINLQNESTWWDNIPNSALKGQPLPSPPTGSFDVVNRQRFTSYRYGTDSTWSEGKYQYAISSIKCLEMSIVFLISRAHFVAQRDLSTTFCIDAVAISKGICRCCDASRAIQDRLNALTCPEEDITKLFDASNVMDESWRGQPLSHALKLEREYLFQLGSSLGRCAEKLVCLALQDARRMATRPPSISQPESSHQWAYFIGAMSPALDHTEMETKGVGCAFGGKSAEASMSMAQSLRQEMDNMKSCMK
ncbi:hypothetical protein ACHAXR_012321 [Thalassiosira sp. AJA248-18]